MLKNILLTALVLMLSSTAFATGFADTFNRAGEWQDISSEHFVVLYKKAPQRFVDNTLARAEEDYRKTADSLGFARYKGWIGSKRARIYIYDDADDYKRSSGPGWAAGSVVTHSRTISAYPSASGFFDSTLPHEIGHIILRDFIGSDAVVPLWFEEGLAMYQEESGRWGANADVRRALARGEFIPLEDLMGLSLDRNADDGLVRIFYAEAASLVRFLITEGELYRFSRLCREIRNGGRFDGALKKSYMKYQTLQSLETAWKDYLDHEKRKE